MERKDIKLLFILLGIFIIAGCKSQDSPSSFSNPSPSAPSSFDFQWPDSSSYNRAMVNTTDAINYYVTTYPQWFVKDKIITDFAVRNFTDLNAAEITYRNVRDLLTGHGLVVGTYISGTTAMPTANQIQWPFSTVPIEQMPSTARYIGSWPGESYRMIINISDAPTRHALQVGIQTAWEAHLSDLRFVDNAASHPSVGGTQPWADQCTR